MNYVTLGKHILHELAITPKHIGYKYILFGIERIHADKSCIEHITKFLYVDIARKFNTTSMNVERGIRATIEIIWRNNAGNTSLLIKIFGEKYKFHRPANTDFFELLYAYMESYDGNVAKCPFFGCEHCVLSSPEIFSSLDIENQLI